MRGTLVILTLVGQPAVIYEHRYDRYECSKQIKTISVSTKRDILLIYSHKYIYTFTSY